MSVSRAARLRRRYLAAIGMPATAGLPFLVAPAFAACTQTPQLVSAPLFEGDAATLASATLDAGKLPVATASTPKTFAADPPEPVPPARPHSVSRTCHDDLDAPARAELPPPFEQCPRRSPNGGQFSAAATRAERANSPETCCYVTFGVMVVPGRALRDGNDRAVVARATKRADWSARVTVAALAEEERAERARAWLADAALEHASVASFARFALDLLAHGAPPDLVAGAHEAALDEIEHARIAYAFASAYAGESLGPSALSVEPRSRDLAALARETFADGCVGETLAALEARAAAGAARDPAVRAALLRIARDEERHAELAWRAVAWMLRTGGEAVRAALRDATQIAADAPADDAIRAIILPCACALLSA